MDETRNLAAFKRIWAYVWPQWSTLTGVIIWSVVIAMMFTVSLATVIPLLKVMMSEEGLHGWIDRVVTKKRYGMDFYVPDRSDLLSEDNDWFGSQLLITDVERDEGEENEQEKQPWAAEAGLYAQNRIISVHLPASQEAPEKMRYNQLLETLATAEPNLPIELRIRVFNETGSEDRVIRATTPEKWVLQDLIQWPASFVPREETTDTKIRAVAVIIVGMTVITILRCLARFRQQYLAEKIVLIVSTRMREDVFEHVMHMPVGFFSSQGTSDTTSRILGDVAMAGRGIKVLLGKTLREPLIAISALSAAMFVNWKLTLIFLTSAPLVIGVLAAFGKKIKKATKKSLVMTAKILNRIQGAMNALRVVKVYNKQDHEIGHYRQTNQALLKQLLRVAKVEAGTNPLMDVMGMFAGCAALLVGTIWVFQQVDGLKPSSFFFLLLALGTAAESVRKVSDVWNEVQRANAAAERVFQVLDHPREYEPAGAIELVPLSRQIEFRDIVFTYPGATQPALRGLSFAVPAGQTVAVVGPNGSGKSTLVNLLPRFYDPDRGQILIDGQDIHKATLRSLRDQIGMVTQNVVTFNDTIANNIAYGKADATPEEIVEAARRAYAHEFIEPLPEGYETVIGENSAGFSGGQLQRIIIARAILKDPRILIFDEAMSQIDADSEAKIHAALGELMEGRTCFLIAHRFSTVISADRIVVIDDGQIVGDGRHEALVKTCPVYRGLYETQLLVPQGDGLE